MPACHTAGFGDAVLSSGIGYGSICSANVRAKNKYATMASRAKAPTASIHSDGLLFFIYRCSLLSVGPTAVDPCGSLQGDSGSGKPAAADKQLFQRIE
jgi:hypothetical protein